ncbi:hypothetical protein J2Y46_002560 [Microbacterium sp. BE35]|uniref:hypothetical protein n=1 Tax=Microbacterium sp. BE35 TaxID=2817773 RepID=UPI002854AADF|nr:hypothetical protein [Microbacterium sp. BE35]MDR7189734.1 hypothetical protein [Microbacterium sp. BE35]
MPNQPATIIRGVRVPDELWADVKFIAKRGGYSGVSEMTREDYERRRAEYVLEHGPIDRESDEYREANRAR